MSKIIDLARESVVTKHKNAKLSERNRNMKTEIVEARVAGGMICSQIEVSERQVTVVKEQEADAGTVLINLANKTSQTEAVFFWGWAVVVEKALNA